MLNDSKHIVLTGATGFLGGFLMSGLLTRGYNVTVLGRSSKDTSLEDRLLKLIHWFGIDPGDRLNFLEIDLSKRCMGLDDKEYLKLCESSKKIIHCASDTSFAERNRKRVMETNVLSLPALLTFAKDSSADQLYYVSSAYACGLSKDICKEETVISNRFTNVYEESKAQAEEIIQRKCLDDGIPLSILRPSIAYGHSETGKALKFNALYYAVKSMLFIRDIFVKDITDNGGERCGKWGFQLNEDGILQLDLNIYLPNSGTVNLIPVDFFVESALRILESSESGGIYHITNDNPPDMNHLIEYSQRFLGIRGIRPVLDTLKWNLDPNPAEELFDKLYEPYRPYLSDTRIFDRSRAIKITQGLTAPALTYELFEKCMTFAIENDWGKIADFSR